MRPYKIVIGCTQILPALQGTESIKLQLYSQQDYQKVLACTNSTEILEQVASDSSIVNLPKLPPEVTCSTIFLPFISLHIRVKNERLQNLLVKLRELFPKKYYIEVQ